jgi:predicted esterase
MVPATPVLLHHARRDQIVSFKQSVGLREDWERLGVDARLYVTRGGLDHISGAMAGTPVALDWIERRLARLVRMPTPEPVVDAPLPQAA